MKKTLLWIGIPSVLVIGVTGFVFFNMRDGEPNQNIIENVKPEQDIQSNQEIIDENIGRTYLSAEECYDEYGVLNENLNIDDNGNIINCYNEQGELHGKWVRYIETPYGNIKYEENYKNGKKDGKSMDYDKDGRIRSIENYKNGERDGERINYFDGERILKTIYKSGEIIYMQENGETMKKFMEYYESENLRLENIWNNFSAGGIINNNDFEDLATSVHADYNIYYDEIINDEEIKQINENMYRGHYEEKSWELLALYSMMNCSEDPSNPDTYLFNLDDPKLAQEIYFKNCPKGCRYSDEEDIDFICE